MKGLLSLLTVLTALAVTGCSEARKLAKAENRVLADSAAVARVAKVWEKGNPCINDTVLTEKTDTVGIPYYVEVERDGDRWFVDFDTAVDGVKFSLRIDTHGKSTLSVSGHKQRISTTKTVTVEDTRRLGLARDSVDALLRQLALCQSNGEVRDSLYKAEIKSKNKGSRKTVWTVAAALGVPLLFTILLLVYRRR